MVDPTAAYERGVGGPGLSIVNGDRASAERALRATIQTFDGLEGSGPEHASALLKMGTLKQEAGEYSEAEDLFQRALEIGERALGRENPALVPALTSLSAARIMCGKFEAAEPLVIRALAVSENGVAEQNPDLVILLNDLARLCLKQWAHAIAEPLLLRLLAMKRSKGEDHPEVATVLASLATVRQALGRHESAEQLWRRVLDIRERTLAPNHFALATALEHLAEACAARGKIGEALQLLQRGQTIRELTLGVGHSSLRVSRDRIADLQLQASEESLDASGHEAPAPAPERYRLRSADDSVVSAVRDRSAFTHWKGAAPVIEREASTKQEVPPPLSPTPAAEFSAADDRPPVPYLDVLLSIRQELEDGDEADAPSHRAAEIFKSVAATLKQRQRATAISVGVIALLVVFGTVARARSEPRPPAAEETSPLQGSRSASAPVAPEVSSRPVVLVNDPVMARTTPFASAPPVTPSSRARVADQRSPAKKPTARRGEATGISIPSVPSALMAGFDSVVQARSASGGAVGESFPVPLPPVSGAAPRVTFERDDQINASQRARLIGTQPTPRYPYQLMDLQGEVRVRFDVDTSGRPVMSSLLVVNSSNTLMTAAVLKVIPGLRFEPARSGGPDSKAIEDVVQMGFQFRPAK